MEETIESVPGEQVNSAVVDETNSNNINEENAVEDAVSYKSYRKLLTEKKNQQNKLGEVQEKLAALEAKDMESKGQQSELISTLRGQVGDLKDKLKETNYNFAWKSITGEIKAAAIKEGCDRPDALIKLLDKEDMDSLEIGDDFSVNGDDLKRVLEKAKRENDFLFRKKSKPVADAIPSNEMPKKDLSNLSLEEKARLLANKL